jgi:HEPN domain-containing protein
MTRIRISKPQSRCETSMSQDRDTFQILAETRLAEATLLLENGQPSGAYYLAGYAIECALKAIIASGFRANEIPDLKRVRGIYTHDLSDLLSIAGLKAALEDEVDADAEMSERWSIAKDWSEQARYQIWTEELASAMLGAIGGDGGLLGWLLKHL